MTQIWPSLLLYDTNAFQASRFRLLCGTELVSFRYKHQFLCLILMQEGMLSCFKSIHKFPAGFLFLTISSEYGD